MTHKSLETNEFADSECPQNFKLKFDFLERLRKPLTLRSTSMRRKNQESEKISESTEENQTTVFEESETTVAKENQTTVAEES